MDSFLSFIMKAVGFDDVPPTNNPTRKGIDQKLSVLNVPVDNDQTQEFHLAPGAEVTVFNGQRAGEWDVTTEFDLTVIDASTYRLAWNGDGTAPEFRVDREVDLTGRTLALVVNPNRSVTVTADGGTPFSVISAGDVVFIPGVSTGDPAGPFNDLNTGYWTVLTASNTVLVMARDATLYPVFSGKTESGIDGMTTTEFQAFSADGVQVGDTVDLTGGFAASALHSYDITAVTANFIEFSSTAPLGEESSATPGDDLVIYTNRKRFVYILSDQEISVRYNDDTSDNNRVEPLLAGTLGYEGWDVKLGTVWSLVLKNRSSARAKITVASAE